MDFLKGHIVFENIWLDEYFKISGVFSDALNFGCETVSVNVERPIFISFIFCSYQFISRWNLDMCFQITLTFDTYCINLFQTFLSTVVFALSCKLRIRIISFHAVKRFMIYGDYIRPLWLSRPRLINSRKREVEQVGKGEELSIERGERKTHGSDISRFVDLSLLAVLSFVLRSFACVLRKLPKILEEAILETICPDQFTHWSKLCAFVQIVQTQLRIQIISGNRDVVRIDIGRRSTRDRWDFIYLVCIFKNMYL